MPLTHVKSGIMGCKGHVCCFPQRLESICTELPRLPSEVNSVKLLRKYQNESGETVSKLMTIRKEKVLKALQWLVEYNEEYRDVKILESNLDWMGDDKERDLPAAINHTERNNVSIVKSMQVLLMFIDCFVPI